MNNKIVFSCCTLEKQGFLKKILACVVSLTLLISCGNRMSTEKLTEIVYSDLSKNFTETEKVDCKLELVQIDKYTYQGTLFRPDIPFGKLLIHVRQKVVVNYDGQNIEWKRYWEDDNSQYANSIMDKGYINLK
jgi:hypothetical protein